MFNELKIKGRVAAKLVLVLGLAFLFVQAGFSGAFAAAGVNVEGIMYGGLGVPPMPPLNFNTIVYNETGVGNTKLPVGSLVQFIKANGVIHVPDLATGDPTGGDTILYSGVVGDGGTGTDGTFDINASVAGVNGQVVYFRAWNAPTAAAATHYGNSATHSTFTAADPPPPAAEIWEVPNFATNIPKMDIVSCSPSVLRGTSNFVVTVTGANTNFVNLTTTATISGTGVTIVRTTALSLTSATVEVSVDIAAPTGNRDITLKTGAEVVTGEGLFVITGVVVNNPPDAPTALAQYKSDATTVIPNGQWTNQSTVVLKFDVSDPDTSDTITPQAEVTTGTFVPVVTHSGPTVAEPANATITVSGLADGNYIWQARARDAGALTSAWVPYNATAPNFKVDTTVPTNPTTCTETGGAADNTWQTTINDPAFTWSGALDTGGAGVHGYAVYWGTDPNGDPGVTETQTLASYDPPAATLGNTYYLRVRTFDSANLGNAGNYSAIATLFTFRYGTAPVKKDLYEKSGGIMEAYPNPFNPNAEQLSMLFGASTGEAINIYILDTNARVIWQQTNTDLLADRIVKWDGKTAYGETVDNGFYIVRVVKDAKLVAKGKILVIKK